MGFSSFLLNNRGVLLLEDGTFFMGYFISSSNQGDTLGDVVFNTSLSGYQEIITDPSYTDQFLVFTYPSIGNYGIHIGDFEGVRPFLKGIVTREFCFQDFHTASQMSLLEYLEKYEIPCLDLVDTRALVRHIREKGEMRAGMFQVSSMNEFEYKDSTEYNKQISIVKQTSSIVGKDLTSSFTGQDANKYVEDWFTVNNVDVNSFKRVCVLDFGIKFSILRCMLEANVYPVVFPGSQDISLWEVDSLSEYDAFIFSNGPGDPSAVNIGIQNITQILNLKKPILAICLGHQMLALALGAKTYKMKFGHHGGNQPVMKEGELEVKITAQNHGFAVERESLKTVLSGVDVDVEISGNDGTVEAFFIYPNKKFSTIWSIQYHPESGPGPEDTMNIFKDFSKIL